MARKGPLRVVNVLPKSPWLCNARYSLPLAPCLCILRGPPTLISGKAIPLALGNIPAFSIVCDSDLEGQAPW